MVMDLKYAIHYHSPNLPAELGIVLSTKIEHHPDVGYYELATSILCPNGHIRHSEFGLSTYKDLNFVISVIKLIDEQNGFI